MLNKIIHYSLHNRLVVLCAAILLLIAGTYTAMHTEVDVFPDLNAPTVVIMTEANGMAAEEVEQLVTFRRNSRKRGYRRAPCPFFFDQRFLRCLGRIRLGHRYIPRPSDRQRKARRSQRVTSRQRGQADSRPPIVHLGRNAHRRSDRRLHLHARSADDCRLDDPPAPALHRRRGTGGSARRRHQGISDSVGPRTDASLRRIDGRSDGRHPRHEPERQRRRTLRIWQ